MKKKRRNDVKPHLIQENNIKVIHL